MKKSKDFKKILIVLSVSALAIFVLHYFMYQDIKSKNERISAMQYDISMKSDRQNYLILTDRELSTLESDLSKAQNAIVSKEGDIKFIEKIESLARNNGLTIEIESLTLENQTFPSPDLTALSLKARTGGGWLGTYMFLAEVESLPFKLKVTKSSLVSSGGESSDSKPSWSSIINVTVLKYK